MLGAKIGLLYLIGDGGSSSSSKFCPYKYVCESH